MILVLGSRNSSEGEELKRHPVIVYWEKSGKTEYYDSIKECAQALKTSTSQIKRLLFSGKSYKKFSDQCTIDDSINI